MAGKRASRGDHLAPRLGNLSLGDCRSGAGVIERRFVRPGEFVLVGAKNF
jgi:hypothetical protein